MVVQSTGLFLEVWRVHVFVQGFPLFEAIVGMDAQQDEHLVMPAGNCKLPVSLFCVAVVLCQLPISVCSALHQCGLCEHPFLFVLHFRLHLGSITPTPVSCH